MVSVVEQLSGMCKALQLISSTEKKQVAIFVKVKEKVLVLGIEKYFIKDDSCHQENMLKFKMVTAVTTTTVKVEKERRPFTEEITSGFSSFNL